MDKDERLKSNSAKLLAGTNDEPIDVDNEAPNLIREESDEPKSRLALADIPVFEEQSLGIEPSTRAPKRPHSNDGLFVVESSGSDVPDVRTVSTRSAKSKKQKTNSTSLQDEQEFPDDKKKLAINTSYDGFNIYGRILCLVVKRKETSKAQTTNRTPIIGGQAMMEDWIASTQVAADQDD